MKQRFIWLVILITPLCIGWSDTLKTSTPAGGDDPREADDRMREIKAAFVERLDIDHYFEASATSTYDATDTGMHRYVTYQAPISTPATIAASQARIYTKDVNSIAELHWIDENEAELQLTSGGTINITSNDLLGTLASDTYFTDANNVDLIKADPNGDAVLPDGAELATNAVPTTDQAIANKKYVDDQITAKHAAYSGGESHTFGSGLIIKMGKVNGTTGTAVTFGTAFPTAIISVQVTLEWGTSTQGSVTVDNNPAPSTTGFTIIHNTNGTDDIYWFAIGY